MLTAKQDIHRRLLIWLNAQNFEPVVDENMGVLIRLQGTIGSWQCRIALQETPRQQGNLVAIHFVSRILTCIPTSRLAATAVMLSSRSKDMNCGCFYLDSHDRTVFYHVSFPLTGKPTIEKFFDLALQQSVFQVEKHFGFLCFFCFNSGSNPTQAECPGQSPAMEPPALTFPGNLDYHSAWVIGRSSQGNTLNATTKPKNTFWCCPNDGNQDEGTWLFLCKKHWLFCAGCTTRIHWTLLALNLDPTADCPRCHQEAKAWGTIAPPDPEEAKLLASILQKSADYWNSVLR